MAELDQQPQEEPVCSAWSTMLQWVLGLVLIVGSGFLVDQYVPPPMGELREEVQQLTRQVNLLKQEQAMPAMVLNRYRDSICYIFGIYEVGVPGQSPALRARVSGTGFVVGDGLLATNRHVAEPWYEDPESDELIKQGARPRLEKLVAFFPGMPAQAVVTPLVLSAHGDLAVLALQNSEAVHQLRPLPLAQEQPHPGELVAVIGYPMGVLGMVAKSPPAVYQRLALRKDDIGAASELAALSLIRPSATCGHLGDVVGDKLIYDAPTAHGGSGGPVFNSRGQVIGINAAYLDGFSGGTLGISVEALRPLIEAAQKKVSAANLSGATSQP
jgi:S1-C subfamily serine protease